MARHEVGEGFPFEPWVEWIVRRYFENQNYRIDTIKIGHSDLLLVHSDEKPIWLIEAKGDAGADSVDFHTALGQLIHRVKSAEVLLGFAAPNYGGYPRLCGEVQQWMCQRLRLHWFIVGRDGSIRISAPDGAVSTHPHPGPSTDPARLSR